MSSNRDWNKIKGKIDLGLCCIVNCLCKGKNKVTTNRTMIRKNFTVQLAIEKSLQNTEDLSKLIEWCHEKNIRCFRISSDIFPHYTDKETIPYSIECCKENLKKAGDLARKYNIRIVQHPGQYNQLGTPREEVFESTLKDLGMHSFVLDSMEMDENSVMIVHGGGTFGNKGETIERWIKRYNNLPENIKKRLVLENDERQYNIQDVLYISSQCGVPIVFDSFHFQCNNIINKKYYKTEEVMDILLKVVKTWGNKKPLFHISNQGEGKIGAHSDYIINFPKVYFDLAQYHDISFSLEVEAKMKEESIFHLRKLFPQAF